VRRRDHPRGLVAAVYRQGIGAHGLMIPPGTGGPCLLRTGMREGPNAF
jgi:hypothetical protein